jgi:Mg-chelatase subunit ChlD
LVAREHRLHDFTAVADIAPTASRDAAGISLAGTTGHGPQARAARPGTLTAGTLDDNQTPDELRDFARAARLSDRSPRFDDGSERGLLARDVGIGPRTELLVVDAKGRAIDDAELLVTHASRRSVRLRTGTDGRAVINGSWDLNLEPSTSNERVRVVARKAGVEVGTSVVLGAGPVRIELPLQRKNADTRVRALDLLLVVDTTGSMHDELEWLATELRAVVARALADHPKVDARLGVVAYRDRQDEYVTRRFEFSRSHRKFEAFLAKQVASGGGDYPEAVDAALAEAASFRWRHDQQTAKVVLLVGDAPPHIDRLRASYEAVSRLREAGVSIYPIAASGVDELAELVFRSIAADTGAQYLFLTDDSGIGNPHAKPHAEDYGVELLHAALLRILAVELRGERTPLWGSSLATAQGEPDGKRLVRAAFELERSLFDDADTRSLW